MTRIEKLTPETLLAAPRRTPGVPNRTGTHVLYGVSTHTWGGETAREVRVMDLATSEQIQISSEDGISDATWIPGTDDGIVYFKSCDKGRTEIYVTKVGGETGYTKVGEVDAPIQSLKMKELDGGDIAFVVAGLVSKTGELLNEQDKEQMPKSSAKIYDTANIRDWDAYFKNYRYSLWYTTLVKADGAYKLSTKLHNLIPDKNLEAPFGMYDIFANPLEGFDICHKGITFLARDYHRERDIERAIGNYPYFMPLDSFTAPPSQKAKEISVNGKFINRKSGAPFGTSIKFSPDAESIAFVYLNIKDTYTYRIFTTSVETLEAFDILEDVTKAEFQDHDPAMSFQFAGSSDSMILLSEQGGRTAISHFKLAEGEQPRVLYKEGSISGVVPLKEGNYDELFVSSHSFIDSSLWQVFSLKEEKVTKVVSSASKHGAKYGISKKQVKEIWTEGADGVPFQSFIFFPSDFDEKKKYPWLLLPHGGPVSSWADAWSTRWNMLLWAEQGYVVIAPNITGSTGFGTEFAARIELEWGGRPFTDLLNLITHLESLPYLDPEKAVLAGASYSGYLVSWFLGHEVIKKFCCAIWHDGVFNVPTMYFTMDLALDDGQFGEAGPYIWNNMPELEKWNPATPSRLAKWKDAPPTLVIHSAKDYRTPITEGLAAFRTLQAHRVPSRFLTFEDEGHWVLKPENAVVWYRTILEWAGRCVGGELKRGDTEW